jgi:putative ABC transport system permease protein
MSVRPFVLRIARTVYRASLFLHRPGFRQRYGREMRATFDDLAAAADGPIALAVLTLREAADVSHAAITRRMPSTARPVVQTKRREPVMDFLRDCRYGFRRLQRDPVFTIVAVLTLAVGVGATTAVFTVVNGVLLRPLPYGDPDRLVVLLNGRAGRLSAFFSPLNYVDMTTESAAFGSTAIFAPTNVNLTGDGTPERIDAADVSPEFFSTLGVTFVHGRGFVREDAASQATSAVVISDGLWKRRFGGSPSIVGSSIRIDGSPYTVVGIAPPAVALPRRAEVWRPYVFSATELAPPARGAQYVSPIARLKPGTTLEQANSALAVVASRLAAAYPRTNKDRLALAVPLLERMTGAVRAPLMLLLGAVGLVLLIACVNVANLFLARTQARGREVAVRAALGAGRRRIAQQLIAESVVLAAIGGAAGLAVAYGCMRTLIALAPASIPRLEAVTIDLRVLLFALAATLLTAVLFGLAPAVSASGAAMTQFMASSGRSIAGGGHRTRRVLIVAEMGLAVMLLVGAGLLVRSYVRLTGVNPGFDPQQVLTFNVSLPEGSYPDLPRIRRFASDLTAKLSQHPGVAAAAGVFGLPLDPEFTASSSFLREGEVDSGDTPSAGMRIITPDYFRVMRIPLKAGRTFDARDDESAPEVVIINEQAARRYWPNENPIGRKLRLGVRLVRGVPSGEKTIVGVVGDVKYSGLDASAPVEVYLPHTQHPVDGLTFVVRTPGDPTSFIADARAAVAALDPQLPLARVQSMEERITQSVSERRFTMLLLAVFAMFAVTLSAVGVYGVLSYIVTQRTREVGVRVAMGAAPRDVVRMFVGEGALLAIAGLSCGLAAAWATAHWLQTMLFEVNSWDPGTFAAVACLLAAVAVIAAYVPARRAATLDPIAALRVD